MLKSYSSISPLSSHPSPPSSKSSSIKSTKSTKSTKSMKSEKSEKSGKSGKSGEARNIIKKEKLEKSNNINDEINYKSKEDFMNKILDDFLAVGAVDAVDDDEIIRFDYQLDDMITSQYSVCPHCHKPFQGKTSFVNHLQTCKRKRESSKISAKNSTVEGNVEGNVKGQRKARLEPVNMLI